MFGKRVGWTLGLALGAALSASIAAAPGVAQAPKLAMLSNLERGEWTIRFRDGSPTRKLCLRSGQELIRIRHSSNSCSQFVVEDTSKEVTVQYTCQGEGYARTRIRAETRGLAQITSNGIAGGLPFQFEAEARRTGDCG